MRAFVCVCVCVREGVHAWACVLVRVVGGEEGCLELVVVLLSELELELEREVMATRGAAESGEGERVCVCACALFAVPELLAALVLVVDLTKQIIIIIIKEVCQ